MRASHRRLVLKLSFSVLLQAVFAVMMMAGSARAQQGYSIPGTPGDAEGAALGLSVSDTKLGSVLFFNYYTSDAASSQVNTRISITNANPLQDVALHLFFVDSVTCNIADAFTCLTRQQTYAFTVSDFDPNVTGYLVVVAVDSLGRPFGFNYLSGDELVVTPTAHRFGLSAMAAARRDGSFASPVNSDGLTSTIYFNGNQYDFLPFGLMLDNFPSQVSGPGAPLADTRLYVYTPLPDLYTLSSSYGGSLFFLVYDDEENGYSGTLPLSCYLTSDKQRITSVRTAPNLTTIVPSGRSGWARFYANGRRTVRGDSSGCLVTLNNVPLMGATATKVGFYTGGHNLRQLSNFNVPGFSITIPAVAPYCGPTNNIPPARDSRLCPGEA